MLKSLRSCGCLKKRYFISLIAYCNGGQALLFWEFCRNQGGCRKDRYFIVGGGGGGVEKEVVVQNCATGASGSARPHSFYCRL